MKKFIITTILCVAFVAYLWAQAKTTPLKASIVRGQEVYNKTCMTCHQKNGGGVPHLNPPLTKTSWVLGDKKKLATIVIKGMNQPVEINDEEYTNAMPGLPHLTDQQIADVLTFVRNSFGNKASAVTVAEVKAARLKAK